MLRGELLQQRFVFQHFSGAEDDGRQRLIDDVHRQLRLFLEATIQVAEQHAAPAEGDAAIEDVG